MIGFIKYLFEKYNYIDAETNCTLPHEGVAPEQYRIKSIISPIRVGTAYFFRGFRQSL